jgi:hypothetical protein
MEIENKAKVKMNAIKMNWSGGAGKPAHGMRISRVEAGPASAFCPLCVINET